MQLQEIERRHPHPQGNAGNLKLRKLWGLRVLFIHLGVCLSFQSRPPFSLEAPGQWGSLGDKALSSPFPPVFDRTGSYSWNSASGPLLE